MTTDEAAKLLELPPDASPDQLEIRFNELRARLEDKLAKAPTPGLKDKYRRSLEDVTKAFETLVLAADASTLPVLQRLESGAAPSKARAEPAVKAVADAPPPVRAASVPSKKKKGGSKEFVLVSLIAIVVLGGGGWWVMKTRAERAERIRIEAEEKARQLAAEKAEADRIAKLTTQLRTQLAEARVNWEAYEGDLRDAERRTSELKSELRGLRDATEEKKAELSAAATAQEIYTDWLKAYLARHPAKIARVRTEQMLEAKAIDDAAASWKDVEIALEKAADDIGERKRYVFDTRGVIDIESVPAGVHWILTDAYGRVQEGETPARVGDLPLTHLSMQLAPEGEVVTRQLGEFTNGKVAVRFVRPGWEDQFEELTLESDDTDVAHVEYPEGVLTIESLPSGVSFQATNALGWKATGVTPVTIDNAPPGAVAVKLSRSGYKDLGGNVEVKAGETASIKLDHRAQDLRIAVAEPDAEIWFGGRLEGRKEVLVKNRPPGEYPVELRLKGYKAYKTKLTVKQEPTTSTHRFSFASLSTPSVTCSSCSGRGHFQRSARCDNCNGRGTERCGRCQGRGSVETLVSAFARGLNPNTPPQYATCEECRGTGREKCYYCEGGKRYWQDTCTTCGGGGKVSQLDAQ